MKKQFSLISSLILTLTLQAEVITITPFAGFIDYSDDAKESIKSHSYLGGFYSSIGTLEYLGELAYSYVDTTYKESLALENLKQHDVTLSYGAYDLDGMYKVGLHYTYTNDLILNDGITAIASLGGYHFFGYSKLSYGVQGYYSLYPKGRDETQAYNTPFKAVSVLQSSVYLSYYHPLSYESSNTLSLQLDYQYAPNYVQQNYLSYTLSDSFYYHGAYATLSAYFGEMRSGVKDGGFTVYNSLDLHKSGLHAKIGYYFTPASRLGLSYSSMVYQEYFLTQDTRTQVGLLDYSYRF